MSLVTRVGLAAAVVGTTVALAGCGSSGGALLSSNAASALSSDLTQASNYLSEGDCVSAQNALSTFKGNVSNLTGVNSTLVRTLSAGAATITSLAERACSTGATTTTTSTRTATGTTTTQTQTTTTESQTTSTATPTVISTATVPTTPSTPTTPAAPTTPSTPSTPTPPGQITSPASGGAGLSSNSGNGNSQIVLPRGGGGG